MNNVSGISSEKFNSEDLLNEFDKLNKNLESMNYLISRGRNTTNEKISNALRESNLPAQNLQKSDSSDSLDINKIELDKEIDCKIKNLLKELDHCKLISEEKTLSQLSKARKKSPLTTQAIKLQAKLHRAIRKGKAWAMKQLILLPLKKKSPSKVYELGKTAFFKMGSENDGAVATMEKLMWDIAVVMGCEDQFVPTGETKIQFPRVSLGQQKTKGSGSSNLIDHNTVKILHKGSIQPAQKGKLMIPYLNEGGKLQMREVISGVCASLVFGLFDAHFNNIFVTDEGKIKFFDNTRSFPNSNGLINRGNSHMVSSYRCCLLDLAKSKKELTFEEIDKLKKDVQAYKQKLEFLDKYLKSREVQVRLEKLPPGWIDLEAAFGAMKERILLMEKALEEGLVKTLEDLASQANPNYKFVYALDFLRLCIAENTVNVEQVHTKIGHNSSVKILTKLRKTHPEIDIKEIKNWCDDPKLSFENLRNNICKHLQETAAKKLAQNELKQRKKEYKEIRQLLMASVRYDLKEYNQKECNGYFIRKIFNEMNIPIYDEENIIDYIMDKKVIYAGIQKKDGDCEFAYRSFDQIFQDPIPLSSNPEKVKIDNEQIDVKEYIRLIIKRIW